MELAPDRGYDGSQIAIDLSPSGVFAKVSVWKPLRRKGPYILLLVVCVIIVGTTVRSRAEERSLSSRNALEFATTMEDAWGKINDYTAIKYKRERHGGEFMPREKVFYKFRKPFSVYVEFVKDDPPKHKNPNLGAEMIFEKGWNNNKIYAHLGKRSYFPEWVTDATSWMVDFTSLDPRGRIATMYQRHTVNEVSFGVMIDRFAKGVRTAVNHPEDDVSFIDLGYGNVLGEPSSCIEVQYPLGKRAIYSRPRVKVCMDLKTKMPTHIVVWNREDEIIQDYRSTNIKVNVGLTTRDFRPDNPNYRFE